MQTPQHCEQKSVKFTLLLPELQKQGGQDCQQNQLPQQKSKLKLSKKFSSKTASSNFESQQQTTNIIDRFAKQELKMSNIEILQSQYECPIQSSKTSNVFPSSFQLIKIQPKLQMVSYEQLKKLNFSVLSYSINELIEFSTQIIYRNQYAQKMFTEVKLKQLIKIIACNYNKISYHNFSHAFSLMLLNFQCLEMAPKFKQSFTSQELFLTFVAGISHDLNHNGTNNMFEIKRKTNLALLYNNQAVLENMHISTLWKILRDNPQLNFLDMQKNNIQNSKKIITQLILSTDMSYHFKHLEGLQKRRKQKSLQYEKFDDRMFMMKQLFHSCDLGNPTLQYDNYISWAALLSHQFNQQAKLQKFYDIQVTKSFEYQSLSTLYNDQVWFVGKIVHPLWKQITLQLPDLQPLREKMQQNMEILSQKMTEEQLKNRS